MIKRIKSCFITHRVSIQVKIVPSVYIAVDTGQKLDHLPTIFNVKWSSLLVLIVIIGIIFSTNRGNDFYFATQSYKANTFNLEDIFDGVTVKELRNKSEFEVTETQSILFGMCFTICKMRKVKAFEFATRLGLRTDFDVTIYFHPKGNELWLLYSTFVLETPYVTLNTRCQFYQHFCEQPYVQNLLIKLFCSCIVSLCCFEGGNWLLKCG
jgi:hypothetical protein